MGKTVRRNCDHCGQYYEGRGLKFCSAECSVEARRNDPLPSHPDENINWSEDDDSATLYVGASQQIRTAEDLIEAANVDLNKWEVTDSKVRTWSVPMKVDGEPKVLQMWYVGINLKKPITERLPVRSLVINAPNIKKKIAKTGSISSVHYSDCHFPHHDDRTLNILYQVLDDISPEIVVDHGDTLDCEQISKYPKDPYNRTSLSDEVKMAARHIGTVHNITPNAHHIWLEGNHEDRLRRVIWDLADKRTAGELLTLPNVKEVLSWESMLGLDSIGWEVVNYPNTKILFNRLVLAHGSKVRAQSAASAKAEHDQYGKSGISGHTHRMGSYYHTDFNGPQVWIELGMMGRIRNEYVAHANWQQGFCVISWNSDRTRFGVEPINVHDGKAFFRGRIYDGN